MKSLAALALAALTLLAGCAAPGMAGRIAPGSTRDQVLASSGPPSATYPLPGGGTRLQYTLQPFGQQAWNVDLDAAGRVATVRQVLSEAEFNKLHAGTWTRDAVLREFGPPARIDGVASWNGPVWTYRWHAGPGGDMFYHLYFDPQGVLRRAHPAMEYINVREKD